MIDTDKYMDDVDEICNIIMNDMDDEEREFAIKTRIRERNRIILAAHKLYKENQRLRKGIKSYLDLEIETHELKELIE